MLTVSKDFGVRHATSWPVVELRELGEFKNGVNAGAQDFGRGIPFVNLMDVFGKSEVQKLDYALVDIPPKAAAEYALVKGDVLFVRSSVKPEGVGLAAVLLKDLPLTVFSGFLIRFRPNGNLLPAFAKYCFAEPGFRKSLLARSTISANTNINQQALSTLRVPLPPLAEQRAMVEVLDASEDAVRAADELIERKVAYKKALAESFLTGRARFPGFGGAWCDFTLGELFDERTEASRSDLRLLSVTGNDGVVDRNTLVKRDTSSEDKSKYLRVCPGDVAYNTMRMWQGVFGVSTLEGIVSPAYTVCIPRTELVLPRFIEHFFKLPHTISLFKRFSQGLVDDTLNLKFHQFAQIRVTVPDLEEQSAIADILGEVDTEIALLRKQREVLNEQKKGLMQKLLTGEVRLKEFRK